MATLAGCGGPGSNGVVPINGVPDARSRHHTFKYTGAEQDFQVPTNVERITVIALGASGGASAGRGGRIFAVIPVTSGETLAVFVGGAASGINGGFNGGANGGTGYYGSKGQGYGGGGASDVREGGDAVSDRILVAGGGGGQAGSDGYATGGNGGKGGGSIGGAGAVGGGGAGDSSSSYNCNGGGGAGGTQSSGGAAGAGGQCEYTSNSGSGGNLLDGGAGGNGAPDTEFSGYGPAGGGAGGGYYGGGGGGAGVTFSLGSEGGAGGGGGGGSSYIEPSAHRFASWQGWKKATGNGLIVLSW
jgi:hypothetical protein